MNTWKVILATMVIFAAGVVTGGMLSWKLQHAYLPYLPQRPRPAMDRRVQPPSPGGARLEFLRRAQRDLNLTPEQRERIDAILKESQERNRQLMEPVAPQIRLELQRTKEEFRQVLTPEQRARFDELIRKQQHPREQHRPTGAPGGPAANPTLTNL